MVEGCGMGLAKGLLFVFNFLFFLAGMGIIIVGALALTTLDEYWVFMSGSLPGFTEFILVVGSIVLIIGFFGCCGACRENYCMLVTFSLLMVIIFIIEVAGTIGVFVARDDVTSLISDGIRNSMNEYAQDGSQQITVAWTEMQSSLRCCGALSPDDWNATTYGEIPGSCYNDAGDLFTVGCLDALIAWAQSNLAVIGGALIGLIVVQICGICISCALAKEVKRQKCYDKV